MNKYGKPIVNRKFDTKQVSVTLDIPERRETVIKNFFKQGGKLAD